MIGEQVIGLGVMRLLLEDLLGPAQALLGMAVIEQPAGGLVLEGECRPGASMISASSFLICSLSSRAGGRVLLGPRLGRPSQPGQDQAPLVMDFRLAGVQLQGAVDEPEGRFEAAPAGARACPAR